MDLELTFGAMAPTILAQLARQGVQPNEVGVVSHWQRDADAIARLKIRGLISDSQARQARQRLLKNIVRCSSTTAKR